MGSGNVAGAPPKRRAQKAATHQTIVYGPMCKVKFVYKDDPGVELKNRYVLYWLYNAKETDLDYTPDNPNYWSAQGLLMPAACGRTGQDGFLKRALRPEGMVNVIGLKGERYLRYNRAPNEKVKDAQDSSLFMSGPQSTEAFPQGRKVGFMLLPPDVLSTFETRDLVKMPATAGAWVGKITQDGQVVEIPCTVPEWIYRIRKAVEVLEDHQERYAQYVTKHLASVAHLEVMSMFVQHMVHFPQDKPGYGKIQSAKNLVDRLEGLKKSINDWYITNDDPSSVCGYLLDQIEDAAKSLWKLIKNKAFTDELNRYMPFVIDKPKEGVHGPDTTGEYNWKEIFDVLGRAYDALAKSKVSDEVFPDHIEPLFGYLASLSGEAHPDWPSHKNSLIDELRKEYPGSSYSTSDNPLLAAVDKYGSLVQSATSDAPGLPALVEAIINSYGLRMARRISVRNPVVAEKHIRTLFGFLKLVRMGKELTGVQKFKLAQAAGYGDLRTGKANLFEYTTEFMGERYTTAAANAFHGGMFLLAIVSFGAAVTTDDDITIRKWAKIVAGTTNLTLTSLGVFFARYKEAALFKVGTASLGIIAGVASIIICSIDAYENFKEGQTARAVTSLVAAGGSLALTIGFGIMAFGEGTAWTGVGTVLILVGVVVTIVASIVQLVMDLFHKETETAFADLRKAFSKDGSEYATVYINNPDVKGAFDAVVSAESSASWWLMSWRAIVPLYNMGYRVVDAGTKKDDLIKTAQSIERLIDSDSDVGSYKVNVEYLLQYMRALRKPDYDADDSGTPDFIEWQDGTIFPNRKPPVNELSI